MTPLAAGQAFPQMDIPKLGGGTLRLGAPNGAHDWQLIVVYRGLHCPICKRYLSKLDEIKEKFFDQGVDIVAVSGDPEDKAQAMQEETGFSLPLGYALSIEQMARLGLYVSDPRSAKETDRPFPEPGLFVVNAQGEVQILDVSNAPFARPDLEGIANGIKFIRANDYPIRGTHRAA
ncbi:redoxin domain-containing protein [Sulfitobacter aestuariivivens]|uniref:Redoxin domain-containing protein n=1 Tax=Sulfitobacter aestuariivivens TaxID=2766981 RepID=A0A927HER3_9RHOB|nr:redoxin domain-containing protein [Sulfitobacter aestuariivivens]MBD3663653.1 redoxin domain-containing protein [Sulfitobacter aestuariivivens]